MYLKFHYKSSSKRFFSLLSRWEYNIDYLDIIGEICAGATILQIHFSHKVQKFKKMKLTPVIEEYISYYFIYIFSILHKFYHTKISENIYKIYNYVVILHSY